MGRKTHVGGGGIGSHKHGVSGRVPTNKTNAMRRAREENERNAQKQKLKELKKEKTYGSIEELMKNK